MFSLNLIPSIRGGALLQYRSKDMERFINPGMEHYHQEMVDHSCAAEARLMPIYDQAARIQCLDAWKAVYQMELVEQLDHHWFRYNKVISMDLSRFERAGLVEKEVEAIYQHEMAHLVLDHLLDHEAYEANRDEIEQEADLWAVVEGGACPAALMSGMKKLLDEAGIRGYENDPHFAARFSQLNDLI